ncbi:hypothetical protein EC3006_2884 [Escherichia coli 3006]|nr:hypothetical protein EC3006_2884 [Escherichia coli 3006]
MKVAKVWNHESVSFLPNLRIFHHNHHRLKARHDWSCRQISAHFFDHQFAHFSAHFSLYFWGSVCAV